MANPKLSQRTAAKAASDKLRRYLLAVGGTAPAPGFLYYKGYHPERPASPPTAYFLRQYANLYDALRAYKSDRSWLPHDSEAAEHAREGVRLMMEGLGRQRTDYGAAETAFLGFKQRTLEQARIRLSSPNHPNARIRAVWEIEWWIHPLISAYSDPARFFREVVPLRERNRLFDRQTLFTASGDVDPESLGAVLATWGFGATLNRNVREALDAADATTLNEALAIAEGRRMYRDGRPPKPVEPVRAERRSRGRPRKLEKDASAWALVKRSQRDRTQKS